MERIKEKQNKAFEAMKEKFGYKNPMQAPRLVKVSVSVGIGSIKDKDKIKIVEDRLTKITGQKPALRAAKKSIATFKIRTGDPVGYQVVLRGHRMYDFLDRLINVSLPRTKDFRGISKGSVDEIGNYTLGIKEHTIFAETPDEEVRNVFGLSVTVVTTSKDPKETLAFLEYLGWPFKKVEEKIKKQKKEDDKDKKEFKKKK